MEYFNLDITIMVGHFGSSEYADSRGKDYPVAATFAKGGEASATMQFPFDEQALAERLEDVEQGMYNVKQCSRVSLPEGEERIQNFGQDLFNALFSGRIHTLYETVKRGLNRENEERLRIRLRIHSPELAVLPWELMYDPHTRSYLCLDRSVSLVRYQELNYPFPPLLVEFPLNILGMVATPKDQGKLDIQLEKKAIKSQLKPLSKSVKLNWLSGSGWDDLRKGMTRGPWHIFHFIGHGSFNASTNEGFITLVDTDGNSVPINARDLSLLLDHRSLRLVILNTCEGARGDRNDSFSSIASILAQKNIPAIIAMQYKITDKASIKFARAFYETLIKGQPLDAALFEARLALKGIQFSMEWAIPVLHMRSRDGNLFTLTSEPLAVFPISSDLDEKTITHPLEQEVEVDRSTTVFEKLPIIVSSPLDPGKKTKRLPLEQEEVVDTPVAPEQNKREENVPSTNSEALPRLLRGLSRKPVQLRLLASKIPLSVPKFPRWVYIPVASIIIFMLVLGGVFVLPSILRKPSPDLFPALCSGNFQSVSTPANTAIVPTPPTSKSPDGETIGLSEGTTILDLQRSNAQEVQYKLQAARAVTNDPQNVSPLFQDAINIDRPDAEPQIYLEDQKVLHSGHPHITFVVGVSFASAYIGGMRSVLQGAFTAQKECNEQNSQDGQTQIVLVIANIGGEVNGQSISHEGAKLVTDQIVDQAAQDKTIVGIMGWILSSATADVQDELQKRGSNLILLSPEASSEFLTGRSHFFRVCPINGEQSKVAANFVLKQKKKVAVLYQLDNASTYTLQQTFVADMPQANIVGSASFTTGDSKTIQDALNKVLAQKPEAIFFSGFVSDLVALLKDISSVPQANNLLIVGGDALSYTNDYPKPLPDLHNVYFTTFADANEWDGAKAKPPFFQEYQNNFGMTSAPNGLPSIDVDGMFGYDAMLTLLDASQQALSTKGTITSSDLEGALKKVTGANAIQGVTGSISFKANGDQQNKIILLEHIQGTSLKIDEIHGCLQKDNCANG